MIYPSISDLTQGNKFNRYTLVIATAKCARMVTDEYVKQREYAEKMIANKETDKSLISMIKREYRDEKALKNAINRLNNGEFKIMEFNGDEEEAAAAKRFADYTFNTTSMRQAVTYEDVADVVEADASILSDIYITEEWSVLFLQVFDGAS